MYKRDVMHQKPDVHSISRRRPRRTMQRPWSGTGNMHKNFDLPVFNNLCTSMKVDLFNKILKIPIHVLHPLLPPPVSYTQRYGLRPRVHDRTLPERSSNLVDCNFTIRTLYLNAYWLNNRFFTLLVCYVLLYVVALCAKMRHVILSIKRLLIDWLIDWHWTGGSWDMRTDSYAPLL